VILNKAMFGIYPWKIRKQCGNFHQAIKLRCLNLLSFPSHIKVLLRKKRKYSIWKLY